LNPPPDSADTQAEKMRALGQFAAQIAHDFNNVLTRILGHTALATDALAEGDVAAAAQDLLDVDASATRGAELVRKLLGFSRRQPVDAHPLRLSEMAEEGATFLRSLLPATILIETRISSDCWISADPVSLEHMLLNLATNARDAMPGGGTLVVEVERRTVSAADVEERGWGAPGEYCVLAVEDSGAGIPPELLDRVLDPFFTTKAAGQGTGLGLAMVYGLMKQHDGWIDLDSVPGRGTRVELLFPRSEAPAEPHAEPLPVVAAGGSEGIMVAEDDEGIMVAEDDEGIRLVLARVLERHGYTVRTARDGAAALEMLRSWPECDLLITDLVMPRMSGVDLYRALRDEGMDLPVLLTSGEGSEQVRREEDLSATEAFLAKPWIVSDLLRRVREILDRAPVRGTPARLTPSPPVVPGPPS